MNVLKTRNKQGFTIIEVVLVLAIAALIFLMVFIALPALQRNQRDTARKTILGKVTSGITSYQSNHRGANPSDVEDLAKYVDAESDGVIDGEYQLEFYTGANKSGVEAIDFDKNSSGGSSDIQLIRIVTGAKCDSSGEKTASGNRRNAAVLIGLENGNASLCQSV